VFISTNQLLKTRRKANIMRSRSTLVIVSLLTILAMLIGACAPAPTTAPAAAPAAETEAAGGDQAAAAPAGEFNWRAHEGESLKLLLNQHPYQQALVGELPKFTELTGMEVT
jgi:multiple sugar transport system substrate-binding protein